MKQDHELFLSKVPIVDNIVETINTSKL